MDQPGPALPTYTMAPPEAPVPQAPIHSGMDVEGGRVGSVQQPPDMVGKPYIPQQEAPVGPPPPPEETSFSMIMFAALHVVQFIMGAVSFSLYWYKFVEKDSVNGPFKIKFKRGECHKKFANGEVGDTTCEYYNTAWALYLSFVVMAGISTLAFAIGSKASVLKMRSMRAVGHIFSMISLVLITAALAKFGLYIDNVDYNVKSNDMKQGYNLAIATATWSFFITAFAFFFIFCRRCFAPCENYCKNG